MLFTISISEMGPILLIRMLTFTSVGPKTSRQTWSFRPYSSKCYLHWEAFLFDRNPSATPGGFCNVKRSLYLSLFCLL